MDPVRNPFVPGAGTPPPELAGRDAIIEEADIALQRVLARRPTQSHILLGLRSTGKTVLLRHIEACAVRHGHVTSFIEAPEERSIADLLYPRVHQTLRQLSVKQAAKDATWRAFRALRAFAGAFKITVGDVSVAVDPEAGVADSGDLELDLSDLFERVGEAARAAGQGWSLFVDEVQYLREPDLAALIVALHRMNQRQLPVVFFGAGLPSVAGLAGEAKSYAERLFRFPPIGPLDAEAAAAAIRVPVTREGEEIDDAAVAEIVARAEGYPYFIQEWGYQAWNAAPGSPIGIESVRVGGTKALARLDESFFTVRFDRLTPKERDYVFAMARLGRGPYRSADVADALGETQQQLAPRRAGIIRKGMIYSPAHGDIAFTVPMFEAFLGRVLAKRTA
jgi:hypothetical protein